MKRIWDWLRPRNASAVALGLLAMSALSATSDAASYKLKFTAEATLADSYFVALGVGPLDPISGTMTFSNFNANTSAFVDFANQFDQDPASFTFHLTHPGPGGLDLSISDTGTGYVRSSDPFGRIELFAGTASRNLLLIFETFNAPFTGPLSSLAGLPHSSTGIVSLLGGGDVDAFGILSVSDPSPGGAQADLEFRIHFSPAVTPLPATLPLFASALGGLGFIGWRRKRGAGPRGGLRRQA